eukprot:TRINITY_DN7415_c0_g1_i2.p1 TRINITY_DN7415_c0_g1~~TRINITY_DN7415_c0_g1_i2.p1  ORF type:complete len:379 (+),score=114.12 TRINITY_DN7415_c0_g1_i2:125-1138(+)
MAQTTMRTVLFLVIVTVMFAGLAESSIVQGDKGVDVKALQYLLRANGYSVGVDGDFGPGTASTVRSFQSSRGLPASGDATDQTLRELFVTVRRGSSLTDAVKALQTLLISKWYLLSGTADGIFGAGTETAARNFQSQNQLVADGIVGPASWTALFSTESGSGSPPGPSPGGASGTRAELAQAILDSPSIILATVHVDQSSTARNSDYYSESTAKPVVQATANGEQARTSCYKNAPCRAVDLSLSMMRGMLAVADVYKISVSEITGGSHSVNSKHYNGWAFDVNYINDVHVAPSGSGLSLAVAVTALCTLNGATWVGNPVVDPAGHSTHIHCQWNTSN